MSSRLENTTSLNHQYSHPYWLDQPLIKGDETNFIDSASIVVIGSGLSGVSVAHHLQDQGFENILMIDHLPEQSASYRNCGHILFGTVESMKAMCEIHGPEKAKELWNFSIDICNMVADTAARLNIAMDYKRDGYLVIADSEVEDRECRESVELLNSMGFQSEYISPDQVAKLGFKNCFGARYERGSAQAHPVKFRNGVLQSFLKRQGNYLSNIKVLNLDETNDGVAIQTERGVIKADAAVIAANAYSPLFSDFFRHHNLIEPFRGQIITSQRLRHNFKVKFPHSFDHGYEYALITEDNRLMLGGWRHHSSTMEVGTYSLAVNQFIENGLKQFAVEHYAIAEELKWEYSWSGIMAASKTGLPFIGNTSSPRIYSCTAYTGHGFSWAHGSAHLLAQIIAGQPVAKVAHYFNPKLAL